MKIVCTNIENCGSVKEYTGKEPVPYCVICENCDSVAFIYADIKNCIYKKNYIKPDIEEIILKTIIKINKSENKNESSKE